MKISDELSKLKTADIYSMMLFALFKLKDSPEYSSLSELSYILEKENFLRLCEYFGGVTIRIPTIDELESVLYALMLYQYVDIDGMSFDAAVEIVGHHATNIRMIKLNYVKIKNVLQEYEFSTRMRDFDEL